MNRYLLILFLLILFPCRIIPQSITRPVGEVSLEELGTVPGPNEKGAEAIVLFDLASAKMIYANGYKIEFTRHVRIRSLNIRIPRLISDTLCRYDKLLNIKAHI
jgi:hypothetical protein